MPIGISLNGPNSLLDFGLWIVLIVLTAVVLWLWLKSRR